MEPRGVTMRTIGGYGPNVVIVEDGPEDDLLKTMVDGAIAVWKRIASMERILRRDAPRGEVPAGYDAKPKGRGLTPRHELWAD